MQITKVKEFKNFFIVNEVISVPKEPENPIYQKVKAWIDEGGTTENEFTLSEIKEKKIIEIEIKRKEFQYSQITINGKTYKNTESAQNKFFNLILTTSVFPINWRLIDDVTWTDLTETQANNLLTRIKEKELSAYQQESNFITLVNAAESAEDINSIDIVFE
jgi:hypothetical protein